MKSLREEGANNLPMDKPILLFDGVCNLCHFVVQFTIQRDPEGRFRFASLQSQAGQSLLERFHLPVNDFATFFMIEGERYYMKSTAALKVLKHLKGLWPLGYLLIVIPRPVRDWIYDRVARNRYHWFGRKETCWVPTPQMRNRFLQ